MSTGYIRVEIEIENGGGTLRKGIIRIFKSIDGKLIFTKEIDENFSGSTEKIEVETPSKELSQHPLPPGILPYEPYDVSVKGEGYIDSLVLGVQAFPEVTAIQKVIMFKLPPGAKQGSMTNIIRIPPPILVSGGESEL